MKRLIQVASVLSVLAVGAFTAPAQAEPVDVLMNPATGNETVLTATQEAGTVVAPSGSLRELAASYNAWYAAEEGKTYTIPVAGGPSVTYTCQELANKKLMDFINVRTDFYLGFHRWNSESYGWTKLDAIRNQAANVIDQPVHGNFRKVDLWAAINGKAVRGFDANTLVSIVGNEMKDVYSSELRTYANEVMIFALRETMRASEFKMYANQ